MASLTQAKFSVNTPTDHPLYSATLYRDPTGRLIRGPPSFPDPNRTRSVTLPPLAKMTRKPRHPRFGRTKPKYPVGMEVIAAGPAPPSRVIYGLTDATASQAAAAVAPAPVAGTRSFTSTWGSGSAESARDPEWDTYHVPGYGGHVMGQQFAFGKSYGSVTRESLTGTLPKA